MVRNPERPGLGPGTTMPTTSEIDAVISGFLERELGQCPAPGEALLGAGYLDSLRFVLFVAHLEQQFGITIQAEHPEATMSRDRAQALVNTFGDTFAARAEGASASSPNLVIRGGNGSQISGVPGLEAIEDCQSMPKNKDCHECCANLGLAKRVCGKACSNGKKASGSEPTP